MEEIIKLQAELNKELANLLQVVKDVQKSSADVLEALIMLNKHE